MAAQFRIDQTGIPLGTAGFSRADGLATGATVTLTSTGGGLTARFRLLWVPSSDTVAVGSLTPVSSTVWTFAPQANRYGSYLIELIVDEGLSTESRSRKTFGIRTPNLGLLIPAANEVADPAATILNITAALIGRSDTNAPYGPFTAGSPFGWHPAIENALLALDSVSGGGGPPTGPAGGDLSGLYPNPVVDGLQGRPVNSALPTMGQVLMWSGADWAPGTPPAPSAGAAVQSNTGVWTVPSGSVVGNVLRFTTTDNTAAVANNTSTTNAIRALGVLAAKPTSTTGTVTYYGEAPFYAGLVAGSDYFLDASGGLTLTPPTGTGTVVQRVGTALNSTTILVDIDDPIVN